jgi:hypothetical protein
MAQGRLIVTGLVVTALGGAFVLGRVTSPPAAGNAAATPPSASPPAFPDAQDALIAAPRSHRVVLENDRVRVVEVSVAPGEREPMHTHRWPSVMYIDGPAPLLYYNGSGALHFDGRDQPSPTGPVTHWMPPEPLHAVENAGGTSFHAIRVELKAHE